VRADDAAHKRGGAASVNLASSSDRSVMTTSNEARPG
jgi:hypothetical protein